MKKVATFLLLIIATFILFLSSSNITVSADTGPKPDMEIVITNLKKSDYIVAYGIKNKYMGPHHAFIPDSDDSFFSEAHFGNKDDLTLIYTNVMLPDGWYLCDISNFYEDTSTLTIKSGYMWPTDFILIIYDKINNSYFLSEETETYAFHSYFKYDMDNYNGSIAFDKKIELVKSYNYTKEILGFFFRLFVSLAIEMLLALAFKFNKKSFIIILITNIVTQVILNLVLNITAYFDGKYIWLMPLYFLVELGIFIAEAVVYKIFCKRGKNENRKWIISYTFLANILSFVLGMILWIFI